MTHTVWSTCSWFPVQSHSFSLEHVVYKCSSISLKFPLAVHGERTWKIFLGKATMIESHGWVTCSWRPIRSLPLFWCWHEDKRNNTHVQAVPSQHANYLCQNLISCLSITKINSPTLQTYTWKKQRPLINLQLPLLAHITWRRMSKHLLQDLQMTCARTFVHHQTQ